jgi:tripartite ATP-independent transporter DctP family solute receptor
MPNKLQHSHRRFRSFALVGVGMMGALIGAVAIAAEQAPLRFRMGTVQAEGIYTEGQRKFVKLVGERTGGKVVIEHFCCNQLGGERQLADGVKLGTIGMAPVGATGSQIYDLLFTPFMFRDREHALKVVNGPIADKWAEDFYKQTGIRVLGHFVQTPRQFQTVKQPIRTPADFKGMKLRAPEIPVIVAGVKALGASPVVIAFPELYTALQQGTADGWEAPVGNMYDSKFYEIAKYLSVVNWTFNCNELLINDDLWKKMTPETQKIVKDTWKEVATETSNKLADDEKRTIEEMKKFGVQVLYPDPAPFREATKNVWKDFAPKVWGPGVYEQVEATK